MQVSLAKSTGLFMKHTNYSIFSKRQNKTVTRRYSDFEPLDAYLRKAYPYRVIPPCVRRHPRVHRLPPSAAAFSPPPLVLALGAGCRPRRLAWAVATKAPSFSSGAARRSSAT